MLSGGTDTGPLGAWLGGVAFYPGTAEILVTDMKHHRVLAWSMWTPGDDDQPSHTRGINDHARIVCGRTATTWVALDVDAQSEMEAVATAPLPGSAGAGLDTPMGIAVDERTGAVWVVDKGNDRICVFR